MKKKEVISYSSFSMEPGVSYTLYEGNKGAVDDHEDFIQVYLDDFKILNFWDKVDKLGVWNWRKRYPYNTKLIPVCDCHQWELKLRDRKGRAKYCAGMGSYPRNYIKLMHEFNNLFGVDIKHHIR